MLSARKTLKLGIFSPAHYITMHDSPTKTIQPNLEFGVNSKTFLFSDA